MNTDQKIKVYCVFAGLGKTYFCQHNPGWVEIEEESYVRLNARSDALILALKCYHKYGYALLTNATPYVIRGLMADRDNFDITIIVPPKGAKETILQRIRDRGDDEWANMLKELYDYMYDYARSCPYAKIIYAQEGEYLTDVMNRLVEEEFEKYGF